MSVSPSEFDKTESAMLLWLSGPQLTVAVIQTLIDRDDSGDRHRRQPPRTAPTQFTRETLLFQRAIIGMPVFAEADRAAIAEMIRDVADQIERSGKGPLQRGVNDVGAPFGSSFTPHPFHVLVM